MNVWCTRLGGIYAGSRPPTPAWLSWQKLTLIRCLLSLPLSRWPRENPCRYRLSLWRQSPENGGFCLYTRRSNSFFFVCILMYFWWIFNIYCSLPHSFKGHSLKWIEIIFMFAILRKHNPYNKRSGSWLGFCERFNKKAKRLTRIWPPFPLGTEMTLSVTPKEYPNRTKAYLVLPSAISSTGEYCILWIRVHCC